MIETTHPGGVRREFIVERQGRSFVLYAGLLDMAHGQGLKEIVTDVIQFGTEENGQTWLFRARVTTDRGTFTGFGDANPGNVARAMLTVIPRMAETRAKARALRDAVNVGVAAFEELGDTVASDDDERAPVHHPPPPAQRPQAPAANGNRPSPPSRYEPEQYGASSAPVSMTATPAQVRAIYSIARDQHRLSEQDVHERSVSLFGAAPAELTRKQASEFITSLKG